MQLADRFICVECCAPCSSLYKVHSSAAIELTQCTNCKKNVDPYVEKDWLLISLDAILLRFPAYRHILFNVEELNDKTLNPRRIVQFALASSILRAYQNWEGIRIKTNHNDPTLYWPLLLQALLGFAVQWLVLYLCMRRRNGIRLFAALVLPTAFSAITNLMLIWENTDTVLFLGRVLEATYQCIAVLTVNGKPAAFASALVAKQIFNSIFGFVFEVPCQFQMGGVCVI